MAQRRVGQVVEVERVLASVVAADVALAAQPARHSHATVEVRRLVEDRLGERRLPVRSERDRQLRQEPLEPQPLGGGLQRGGLVRAVVWLAGRIPPRRIRLERVGHGGQHPLVPLVVGLEVVVRHRPRLELVAHERAAVLADEDVRVDERAAAEPAGDDAADPAKGPDVEEAVQALARVPQRASGLPRAARERPRRVRAAALEEADRHARFRQSLAHHRPAETRADDDGVEVPFGRSGAGEGHGRMPPSHSPRRARLLSSPLLDHLPERSYSRAGGSHAVRGGFMASGAAALPP